VRLHRGREGTARLFTRPHEAVEIGGVRKGSKVVVLEFSPTLVEAAPYHARG